MNRLFLMVGIALAFNSCQSTQQKSEANEKAMSGNPLWAGWYADPEGIVFGDEYWIYPTFSAKYEEQVFLDAFSSKDLITWTKHEHIIDTTIVKWANRAMWAPSAIEKNGKYFLFFAANDIQNQDGPYWKDNPDAAKQQGGIGIGVADSPAGPFTDYLGKPLIDQFYNGAQPIDQYVFKAMDGKYYIVYGGWRHCNIGQLNEDFTALVPFEDGALVKEITPEGYVEGPTFAMRNGKYYFMWSEGNWGDETYRVAYAISDSLFGPFERIGTILSQDPEVATGSGHHSVINVPNTDEWYIVYHRRPIPNEGRDHRVTCIDKLVFNQDGTIQPVKITFEGVEARPL